MKAAKTDTAEYLLAFQKALAALGGLSDAEKRRVVSALRIILGPRQEPKPKKSWRSRDKRPAWRRHAK